MQLFLLSVLFAVPAPYWGDGSFLSSWLSGGHPILDSWLPKQQPSQQVSTSSSQAAATPTYTSPSPTPKAVNAFATPKVLKPLETQIQLPSMATATFTQTEVPVGSQTSAAEYPQI